MLVPLLTLVVGILWIRARTDEPVGLHAEPPPLDDERPVPGWSAHGDLADGTRLSVRLTPLNAVPEQQVFDASVLREVLGEEVGEPWRLFLTRSEGDGDALALDGLRLGSLRQLDAAHDGTGPADPVRVLLAPPSDPLGPGQEVSLVLWGPAPEGALDLVLDELTLVLLPEEVPREDVVRSLAQRDVLPRAIRESR